MFEAHSEDVAPYAVTRAETDTIRAALALLEERLRRPGVAFTAPQDVKNYLVLQVAELQHEEFGVLWLNSQHGLIQDDRLFRGSISQTSVYPREVVKAALACNAATAIFYHNHPSGLAEPSRADEMLTDTLKKALALVDVRVLDHIVVGGTDTVSFAEKGLI